MHIMNIIVIAFATLAAHGPAQLSLFSGLETNVTDFRNIKIGIIDPQTPPVNPLPPPFRTGLVRLP
ncbi:hypothetical protein SAMN05720487_11418 [Fibrobacter sp. UWT2]|nr:hypothetical protein SAMN05720487_11418 [Fibrobacter sp. UWT2]